MWYVIILDMMKLSAPHTCNCMVVLYLYCEVTYMNCHHFQMRYVITVDNSTEVVLCTSNLIMEYHKPTHGVLHQDFKKSEVFLLLEIDLTYKL